MNFRRLAPFAVLGAAAVLVLAGCGATDAGADDTGIHIVASTNVYAQIAEEIGGDDVDVTALVASAAQDPHSFEPSARDQLAVNRADLVIENGAGYDVFIDALRDASSADAPIITAAHLSSAWSGELEGFNEHVWYDPTTMAALAEAIADELSELDPDNADAYAANAAAFVEGTDALTAALDEIAASHAGAGIFATEPVSGYLLDAAELDNLTPEAFSEAVEEGQDVPPATLLEALELLRGGTVDVLVANAQTGGAETTQVIAEAKAQSIPVLEFTETLPDGKTYLQWMRQNIADLAEALES